MTFEKSNIFELTNEQRKCFALKAVGNQWVRIEAKPSPHDYIKTILYLDGDTIVKCILTGDYQYYEYELCEKISDDGKYLLPKTAKGKPVLLTESSIQKRIGTGMRLNYDRTSIHLYNEKTQCSYYFNAYLEDDIRDLNGFIQWVEQWCSETTDVDCVDVENFSRRTREHIPYKEGDVFRFKIGRRLYGYGRVILDYGKMRKNKEVFWDILMCRPLVCSVYHMITERKDISISELRGLRSLPSTIIMDNCLYYGEYEIIGNIPVTEHEDYPVMYGESLSVGDNAVCYQCGKVFRKIDGGTELYKGFTNHGVSYNLNFTVDVLRQCINSKSNDPYWNQYYHYQVNRDLRNPKFQVELKNIKKQFGLN